MQESGTGVSDAAWSRQRLLRLMERASPWLPLVGLAAWLLTGGWRESTFQTHNWTILMASLCGAVLIPVRSSSTRPRRPRAFLVTWLGWLFLAGLVFFT